MPPDRDLDRELRDLGPHVEYPPVPDLARSVRDRLEAEDGTATPSARTGPQLWWVAAAALVLLVALPVFALIMNGMGGVFSGGAGMAGGASEGGREESAQQGASPAADSSARSKEENGALAGNGEETAGIGIQAVRTPNDRPVPDVLGLPVLEACDKLRARNYVGAVMGEVENDRVAPGHVVSQKPRAGRDGFQGQPVELTVSEPYPAGKLGHDSRCFDETEYGPGGKPNVPNNGPGGPG